ncbi:MAG: cytochrome P450, partial [Thermomicrobiales bacterium]|nr:cytochrome P450 [Thermomicrobiales bacterium]
MDAARPSTPIPAATMPPPLELAALAGKSLTEQSMAVARASGPIFQRPGGSGPGRAVAVWGFRYVDDLCDERRFDKAIAGGIKSLRAFAGDGLFTAYTDEPNWGKAHRILLPAFSQKAMETYHPQMLDLASQLALKWARLNPGETVDVAEDMTRLTLDTIGLCGFGYRFNSFYRTDLHPYVHGMVYTLDKAMALLMQGGGTDIAEDAELAAYRQDMNAFVDEVIATRKAAGSDGEQARDLLGYMLTGVDKQTGEGLDDVTIRYEINTFLVAGHETTSGLLTFALYFLSKHPDVMAKAQAEVDRVFGTDPSVPPTYEQVRALAYISQILSESLRLWPTAPGFTRHSYASDVLAGDYAIEPDDTFNVLLPMLHRDPDIWGPDAERFNPDNFAPDAIANRPANAYKPFGSGQRSCIGRQFALQEATLMLGMLLQRFDAVDVDDYQLRIRQTLTIKPDGLRLAMRPRAGRAVQTLGAAPAAATAPPAVSTPTPHAAPAARPVDSHGTPLLVLFGSNLGAAEDVAHRLANAGAARGFAVEVAPLDDYAGALPTAGAVVVATASYNGTPPDNAARFCAWLTDPSLPADALRGVSYAVFGCGNHEWYATFQAIPRLIDDELAAHGARRIYDRGEGDAAADFDSQLAAWEAGLWDALGAALELDAAAMTAAQEPLYTVERVGAPANPFLSLDGLRPFVVEANRELQNRDGSVPAERSTRHIEFALPEGASYTTGDHLGVIPRNGIETIGRVMGRFGFAGDAYVRIARNGSGTEILPLDRPVAVLELLNRYVDLQEVASRSQIGALAEATTDPGERDALLALADETRYDAEILAKRVSLIDLLDRYPSCALPFD